MIYIYIYIDTHTHEIYIQYLLQKRNIYHIEPQVKEHQFTTL